MHKPIYSPYFERGQRRASLEIDHFEDFEGFDGSDCEVGTDNDAASQWPPPGLGLKMSLFGQGHWIPRCKS